MWKCLPINGFGLFLNIWNVWWLAGLSNNALLLIHYRSISIFNFFLLESFSFTDQFWESLVTSNVGPKFCGFHKETTCVHPSPIITRTNIAINLMTIMAAVSSLKIMSSASLMFVTSFNFKGRHVVMV